MKIDAHHHLWHYDPVEYDWIDDAMKSIRADFLPSQLKETIQQSQVDGVVTVQARQLVEETEWLLEMAHENAFMLGVVGWLPLVSEKIEDDLNKYAQDHKLKGVRHVIQGEPDPDFILRKDFNRGVSLLKSHNLVYDILVVEKQLPNTIRFVDQHPEQTFVLDHIAKPLIAKNELSPWKELIKALSQRENVSCKLSGMVTEANYTSWTPEQLQPYFDVVIDAFGPSRLLFGSDWPVCLVATTYSDWTKLVQKNIASFSEKEQSMIMGDNAKRIYNL